MKGKSFFQSTMSVLLAIILAFFAPVSTYALSEQKLDMFAQNNILFYDPDETTDVDCAPATIDGRKVTIIGDSISVGAKSEYSSQIPNADFESKTYNGVTYDLVQNNKQFNATSDGNYSGMEIAKVLQEQGSLRSYLVFALGTNSASSVTDSSIKELMELVGTNHNIVLVTNYNTANPDFFSSNNEAIRNAGKNYKNVAVADWAAEVSKNPSAYINDETYHVHPNDEGSRLFVKLIKAALDSLAGGVGSGLSTGGNRNYAGVQVFSEDDLRAIENNKAIYEAVANTYGFPWEILAVVHSMEHNLQRDNPANGEGVYQLHSYTHPDGKNLDENLAFLPAGPINEAEFKKQTEQAGKVIAGKMIGLDLTKKDDVKKLFFRYNGASPGYIQKAIAMGFSEEEAENGEGSVYVMNRYDARRDPTSKEMDERWSGRYTKDGVYTEGSTSNVFGAFVKYEALTGASFCYDYGNKIAETALKISWSPSEGKHAKDDPKQEYVTAMKEAGSYNITPCHASGECAPKGASCDQFVSTVIRYSGVDPDYPLFNPTKQLEYLLIHPELYTEIQANGEVKNLHPGDIFIVDENGNSNYGGYYNRHTYLYVGEIDGKPWQASASYDSRTGENFSGIVFTYEGYKNAAPYRIFRRTGN